MAASSLTPPLSVSYTPGCPNLLHKQPHLISSRLSIPELCVRFSMTSSQRIVPKEIACGTTAISTPITAACVCQEHCVSALFAHACPLCPNCGAAALKRPRFLPASLAPLMCHGQARLLCSHFPSLSFSPCSPSLSLSLSEVSCLYWMVQKQNHKPISVTLAMRLDGPNLSPSGAIGSTPVSLKRPLSSRQRGSFLFGDNCSSCDSFKSKSSSAFWETMACCAHYNQAVSSCVAMFVTFRLYIECL